MPVSLQCLTFGVLSPYRFLPKAPASNEHKWRVRQIPFDSDAKFRLGRWIMTQSSDRYIGKRTYMPCFTTATSTTFITPPGFSRRRSLVTVTRRCWRATSVATYWVKQAASTLSIAASTSFNQIVYRLWICKSRISPTFVAYVANESGLQNRAGGAGGGGGQKVESYEFSDQVIACNNTSKAKDDRDLISFAFSGNHDNCWPAKIWFDSSKRSLSCHARTSLT